MPVGNVYLNGRWANIKNAHISPLDRGFLFGDGCYEVIPVYQKKAFYAKQHVERLLYSLKELDISTNNIDWLNIIYKLAEQNPSARSYVYLQVSRGEELKRDFNFSADTKATIFAYSETLPDAALTKPIHVNLIEDFRWQHCDIKSTSLVASVMARTKAKQLNYDDAIYYRDNYLTEGSISNIFIIHNGEVLTPKASNHLLKGITRKALIDYYKTQQRRVIETDIPVPQLMQATEVFLCSSTLEIRPVTQINQQLVGNGEIGNEFQQLRQMFSKYCQDSTS